MSSYEHDVSLDYDNDSEDNAAFNSDISVIKACSIEANNQNTYARLSNKQWSELSPQER